MATPRSITIKRHYTRLSDKESDEVVEVVADLIVAYLKRQPESVKPDSIRTPTSAQEARP